MQFFTDKMRHDVLSEMSGILKARYLISERVLFHPTKCAAGAMLGTAVQLLGLKDLPPWVQVLGDQEFLQLLMKLANRINLEIENKAGVASDRLATLAQQCFANVTGSNDPTPSERDLAKALIKGARVLLWRLVSRRFSKTVYRLRSGNQHTGRDNDETIATKYKVPKNRYELERELEQACCLPPGAVVIHCPTRRMGMKVAQALVVGSDPKKVAHLRDVSKVSPESLAPYQDEIGAVERMYESIWQFHAFLDPAHFAKHALVAELLHNKLGFPNDDLLGRQVAVEPENSYDLLAGRLKDEFAWINLPGIVKRLDTEGEVRMRYGDGESILDRTRRAIREVAAQQPGSPHSDASSDSARRESHQTPSKEGVKQRHVKADTPNAPRRGARSDSLGSGADDDKQLPMLDVGARKSE
jgi:hypothetical protein